MSTYLPVEDDKNGVSMISVNASMIPVQSSYASPQGYYTPEGVYNNQTRPVTVVGGPSVSTVTGPTVTGSVVMAGDSLAIRIPPPPPGRWRDGICDCFSNLFPSCWCSWWCMHGSYITAQIAQKTNFAKFNSVMLAYWIIAIISWGIGIFWGGAGFFILPAAFVWIFTIALRMHFVRYYNIEHNACNEICIAFWCFNCNIAQMARHAYGYRKVLDGDSDPDRSDNYGPQRV